MKPISVGTKRAVALAAVLFSAACIVSAADDAIPLIRMADVPLADAITSRLTELGAVPVRPPGQGITYQNQEQCS